MTDEDKKSSFMIDDKNIHIIESVCDNMPGGFFIYKAHGDQEILYLNKAMLRIFDCETEEAFRKHTDNSFKGIVHPEDYDRVQKSIEDQINNSKDNLDFVEYRIVCRDGKVKWVEDYGHFIVTENHGDVFYVFIDDETERIRKRMDELEKMNKELKKMYSHETHYKRAILHNAITFFEVNLTKDEFISTLHQAKGEDTDFYEIEVEQKFSEWAKDWLEYTDKISYSEYQKFFDINRLIESYKNGEPEQILDTVVVNKSGKNSMLEILALIGESEYSGDILALVIVRDVTEINERKRVIQMALSEANAGNIARQSFLSNISHNILAPINDIISFTELSSYNSSDSDLLNYCLDKIKESSKKLLEVVDESLKVNNMQSGMMRLRRLECDLSALVDDVKHRIYAEMIKKNIELTIDKSGVKHFNIYTYSIRLEDLLWHLMDNAVKYTGKNGSVTLRITETEVEAGKNSVYTFDVIDNGIGISENFIDKIFEPFKREPTDAVSSVNGSGMGLAVVKNHIDTMKGTIRVESVKGKGSHFTVTIPVTIYNK